MDNQPDTSLIIKAIEWLWVVVCAIVTWLMRRLVKRQDDLKELSGSFETRLALLEQDGKAFHHRLDDQKAMIKEIRDDVKELLSQKGRQ